MAQSSLQALVHAPILACHARTRIKYHNTQPKAWLASQCSSTLVLRTRTCHITGLSWPLIGFRPRVQMSRVTGFTISFISSQIVLWLVSASILLSHVALVTMLTLLYRAVATVWHKRPSKAFWEPSSSELTTIKTWVIFGPSTRDHSTSREHTWPTRASCTFQTLAWMNHAACTLISMDVPTPWYATMTLTCVSSATLSTPQQTTSSCCSHRITRPWYSRKWNSAGLAQWCTISSIRNSLVFLCWLKLSLTETCFTRALIQNSENQPDSFKLPRSQTIHSWIHCQAVNYSLLSYPSTSQKKHVALSPSRTTSKLT